MDERTIERWNALVDGEVDAAERAELLRKLEVDAEARAFVADLERQRDALSRAFAPLVADAQRAASSWRVPAAIEHAQRPSPWGIAAAIAAAALVGFVAGALWFQPTIEPTPLVATPTAPAFARVTAFTGACEACFDGTTPFLPLAQGATLEPGARVRTPANAKATLTLADGTDIRLDANTSLALLDRRYVALTAGKVFSDVVADAAPFVVACDRLYVSAVGTTFEVERGVGVEGADAGKDVTDVRVLTGLVRVGSTEVGPGFGVRAIDGLPGDPTALGDLTILTNWVHELMLLEGDRSEELERRVNDMLAMLGRTKMEHLYEWEIRSLGDHCVVPLTRYVQSVESRADGERRREASRIACEVASPPYTAVLIDLLADDDAQVRLDAARGLERLVGDNGGFDLDYWRGDDLRDGRNHWRNWLAMRS